MWLACVLRDCIFLLVCCNLGWNGLESLTFKTLDLAEPENILEKHQKLGQYMATPIAGDLLCLCHLRLSRLIHIVLGNDISSSILYTLGLVSQRSGQLAPLCLLLVCGVLHFFRYVYSEVIPQFAKCPGCYV